MGVIDNIISEIETNSMTKEKVRRRMAKVFPEIDPKPANYEDARAVLHMIQDTIGEDLFSMSEEPEKYSEHEISTIYGWFDWACSMEEKLCDKENQHMIVHCELVSSLPCFNDVVNLMVRSAFAKVERFYTDEPAEDDKQ